VLDIFVPEIGLQRSGVMAVKMAFKQWQAMQNVGSPQKTSDRPSTAQADERAKPDSEKDAS
jgi:hypothetical protein